MLYRSLNILKHTDKNRETCFVYLGIKAGILGYSMSEMKASTFTIT